MIKSRRSILAFIFSLSLITEACFGLSGTAREREYKHLDIISDALSVKILGATAGSGVLVGKDGSSYTVLTAWHVVGPNQDGESIDLDVQGNIYTIIVDKSQNIKRIGDVDLAIVRFTSTQSYPTARVPTRLNLSNGELIAVTGFPLNDGELGIAFGKLVAFADFGIDQGYQVLYSSPTLAGMSGGAIFNVNGELVGIHGRGEKNEGIEKRIKTGINQGVPISFYTSFLDGKGAYQRKKNASTYDDYYAIAQNANRISQPQTMLRATKKMLELDPKRMDAYFLEYAAYEKMDNPAKAKEQLAISADLMEKYISLIGKAFMAAGDNPLQAIDLVNDAKKYGGYSLDSYVEADYIMAMAHLNLKNYEQSLKSSNEALSIFRSGNIATLSFEKIVGGYSGVSHMLVIKGESYRGLGDYKMAAAMYSEALELDVDDEARSYMLFERADIKSMAKHNIDEVCNDFLLASSLMRGGHPYVKKQKFLFACNENEDARAFRSRFSNAICSMMRNGKDEMYTLHVGISGLSSALDVSETFSRDLLARVFYSDIAPKCGSKFTVKPQR